MPGQNGWGMGRGVGVFFPQVPANGDRNFAYWIGDETTREAAIVDASYAPERAWAEVQAERLVVRYVISTHSHTDHIAGNDYLLERSGGVGGVHGGRPAPRRRRG